MYDSSAFAMLTFASSIVAPRGNAAEQFNDMHHKPTAFFVALEFEIEREIVARDDFVDKRVHR